MKSYIDDMPNIPKPLPKPPCLMRYIGNGAGTFVVLFDSERSGTIVESDNPNRPLGDYVKDFYEVTNKEIWEELEYPEAVILEP